MPSRVSSCSTAPGDAAGVRAARARLAQLQAEAETEAVGGEGNGPRPVRNVTDPDS